MIFIIEALNKIKHQFFFGNDNTGYEPVFGTVSVADGTAFSVEHLFAASVCNSVLAWNIFPSWILRYITGGANSLMQELPAERNLVVTDRRKVVVTQQTFVGLEDVFNTSSA